MKNENAPGSSTANASAETESSSDTQSIRNAALFLSKLAANNPCLQRQILAELCELDVSAVQYLGPGLPSPTIQIVQSALELTKDTLELQGSIGRDLFGRNNGEKGRPAIQPVEIFKINQSLERIEQLLRIVQVMELGFYQDMRSLFEHPSESNGSKKFSIAVDRLLNAVLNEEKGKRDHSNHATAGAG